MCDRFREMRDALIQYMPIDLARIAAEYARPLTTDEKLISVLRFDAITDEYETSSLRFDATMGDNSLVIEWRSDIRDFHEKAYSITERYNGRWQRKYCISFADLYPSVFTPAMRYYASSMHNAYPANYRGALGDLYSISMRAQMNRY